MMALICSSMLAACIANRRVVTHQPGIYRHEASAKADQKRMERQNYRQRKKMAREAKTANRRWDTNALGNVYGL